MPKQLRVAEKSDDFPVAINSKQAEPMTFDDQLLLMIDKTLKEIFKEIGTKAIYNYIEKKYQLEREKIARNPKTFSTGLKALLGSAAPVIEMLIISKLHRELHLKFEKRENVDFSDYIRELRR
jgi:hypothetical protein